MARRYSRDNRGRFASGGSSGGGGGKVGATARGGRLRTAAGNKRATQTTKAAAAKPSGTVAGKVKRNPAAAGKIGQAKASAPKATTPTKLGGRLNPAKKADRKATKAYDTAYNRENRIRTSLFKGNKSSEKKQAIIKELNKASNTTATMLQQRRGIRGSFPVQSKDKVFRAAAGRTSGTISKNKDVRNATNRKEAFKRRVTRAGSLSSTGANKKGRQTARTRAKALATYQGSRRPERSDSTVGGIKGARTSPSFKAPATRLGTPSRAARQQGKALSLAQTRLRDSYNRLIGNPKKVQRKRKTGQRALDFYKNPKATTEKVLKQRGNAGLSTAGFRKPRPKSTAKAAAKPAKAASKVDTSMSGLARRRARANAPRNSTYLSQKLNTRSAITRSAANAIYNEQRKGAKTLFESQLPTQIAKAGLIGKGLSGSKRERAEANREAARKRVLKGKRR